MHDSSEPPAGSSLRLQTGSSARSGPVRSEHVLHCLSPHLRIADEAIAAEPPQSVVELDSGGACVSAETAKRLACDASMVVVRHGADGSVLDVGRKHRTAPVAIRRALAARDRHCQFPGCTARRYTQRQSGQRHHC